MAIRVEEPDPRVAHEIPVASPAVGDLAGVGQAPGRACTNVISNPERRDDVVAYRALEPRVDRRTPDNPAAALDTPALMRRHDLSASEPPCVAGELPDES